VIGFVAVVRLEISQIVPTNLALYSILWLSLVGLFVLLYGAFGLESP
jgi:hypothetical protein